MPCVTFLLGIRVTVAVSGTDCKVSVEGETEQVLLGGPPEHVSITVPVRPPIDFKVMVKTAFWPEGIVSEVGVAVIEKSPTETCTVPELVLPMKFESPLYVAVMVRVPDVANVSEHPPAATLAEQDSPVLAFTITVPLGDVIFVDPVTATPTITGIPGATGFGETVVIVVVEDACRTVMLTVLVALV